MTSQYTPSMKETNRDAVRRSVINSLRNHTGTATYSLAYRMVVRTQTIDIIQRPVGDNVTRLIAADYEK